MFMSLQDNWFKFIDNIVDHTYKFVHKYEASTVLYKAVMQELVF